MEVEMEPKSPFQTSDRVNRSHNDQEDMNRLGKKQEFKRNFRFLATLGFATIFSSTWEFVLVAFGSGLINGGFGGLIWEYVWTFLGYSTIVVSLAEMSSMAPTAGGQYHTRVSEFAPARWQEYLSYAAGWTSTLAWQPALAGGLYPIAVMIQTITQYNRPDFVLLNWQASLLMIPLGFLTVPFNTVWRALPIFETKLVFHFAGFFATIIPLWVLAPKNSATQVFTEITNSGGWSNTGLSLLVGQVSVFYCMAGEDPLVSERILQCTCVSSDLSRWSIEAHTAEEVEDASLNVPRSMVWAFVLNGLMGFVTLITYVFCIGDLTSALNSPEPFVATFLNSTGSTGGATGLTIILFILLIAGNNTCTTTESRQMWAFARDKGLPFSGWLSKIHPHWNVPLNCIIVTIGINIVFCLINLGSTLAFNIIIGLQNVGFLSTYIISIGCLISARLRRDPLPPARWSLGRLGMPINCFAVLYACFLVTFCFLPVMVPVMAQTVNWTPAIFVGVVVLATSFYFVHGRKVYTAPVAYVEGKRRDGMLQSVT
ncbi:amino acid transporter-like protein [Cryomyces antarcticus]